MDTPSAAETDTQAQAVANASGVTTSSLQKTLTEKLNATHVDVEDLSGSSELSISHRTHTQRLTTEAILRRGMRPII